MWMIIIKTALVIIATIIIVFDIISVKLVVGQADQIDCVSVVSEEGVDKLAKETWSNSFSTNVNTWCSLISRSWRAHGVFMTWLWS